MTKHEIVRDAPAAGSAAWLQMITASKVPVILGVSRFRSQYSLWHEMAGNIPPEVLDQDRMQWGHIAEKSLCDWWLYKHPGWKLNPRRDGRYEIAYRATALPFDNLATLDRRAYRATGPRADRFHIVECKTAMTLNDWGRPGEDDSVPADYYAQVMFQMGVSGIHSASAVVLGPFAEPEIHEIEFNQDQFDAIVDACVDWQASLEMKIPPPLDDSPSTYETVRGLHPDIDRSGVVDIDRAQAVEFLDMCISEDEGKAAARRAKIKAAELMGDARLLVCDGVKIADRRSRNGGTPYVQFDKKADLTGAQND